MQLCPEAPDTMGKGSINGGGIGVGNGSTTTTTATTNNNNNNNGNNGNNSSNNNGGGGYNHHGPTQQELSPPHHHHNHHHHQHHHNHQHHHQQQHQQSSSGAPQGQHPVVQQQQTPQQQQQQQQICSACKKAIRERYLLKALDQLWHEDCLKCSCCDCRLGEVGSTLFAKANLLLCRRDYLRLFGTTGYCAACSKMIPAFEMVMRARGNVYHLECFACQHCQHRFCVGDRFYLCDNKILCEADYEERMMFANLGGAAGGVGGVGGVGMGGGGGVGGLGPSPNSPYPGPYGNGGVGGGGGGAPGGGGYNALTQMKRQTQSLSDDLSSGYGSPSPNSL